MKISIDLDGTLFAHKDFFHELLISFRIRGHEVGILTGHPAHAEEHDREKLRAAGFGEVDFYLGRTSEYMHLNGSIFKRDMIRAHGIDLHFDDLDYGHPDSIRLFQEDDCARMRLITMPFDRGEATRRGWGA